MCYCGRLSNQRLPTNPGHEWDVRVLSVVLFSKACGCDAFNAEPGLINHDLQFHFLVLKSWI